MLEDSNFDIQSPFLPNEGEYLPSLSEKILSVKAGNPGLSARKIAAQLGIDHKTVLSHLKRPENVDVQEEIERRTSLRLQEIRESALDSLATLVMGDKIPGKEMAVWLNAVKFVLGPIVNKQIEVAPETLIFETEIADNGSVTRRIEKIYGLANS